MKKESLRNYPNRESMMKQKKLKKGKEERKGKQKKVRG